MPKSRICQTYQDSFKVDNITQNSASSVILSSPLFESFTSFPWVLSDYLSIHNYLQPQYQCRPHNILISERLAVTPHYCYEQQQQGASSSGGVITIGYKRSETLYSRWLVGLFL